jgi:hypothetical protein
LRGLALFYAAIVVASADNLGSIANSFTVGAAEFFFSLWDAVAGGISAFPGTGHSSLLPADMPRGIHRTNLVEFDAGLLKRDGSGKSRCRGDPGASAIS